MKCRSWYFGRKKLVLNGNIDDNRSIIDWFYHNKIPCNIKVKEDAWAEYMDGIEIVAIDYTTIVTFHKNDYPLVALRWL